MGRANVLGRVALGTTLSFWLGACSEVEFSPAPASNGAFNQEPIDNGKMRTDFFDFNGDKPQTKVDVLFVVDNSGSMSDEQAKLSTALSSFVDSLSGVDWQVAITTTDLSGGAYSTNGHLVQMVGTGSRLLNRHVSNYENVFLNTILANGTPNCGQQNCASGNELPLEATRMVVTQRSSPENAGFFRDGADFVTIVLSDEDEGSDGSSPTAVRAEDIISVVNNIWQGQKDFSGYGIIIQPGDAACINAQTANGGRPGTFVQHMADITQGETGSICDTDYGPALASIGNRVKKYATTISLSTAPVPGTITVDIIPADPSLTWTVNGNTIRFSDLPKKGTRVQVTYERAGG